MSDPRTVPRTHEPPPPWRIELEAQAQDPREREELLALVSLLRSLPDPEPPEELISRVLEEVAAQPSRPAVVRAVLRVAREIAEPRVTLALAAGIACLLAVASFEGPSVSWSLRGALPTAARSTSNARPAVIAGSVLPRVAPPTPQQWGIAPVVIHPRFVSLMSSDSQAQTWTIHLEAPRIEGSDLLDARLDQQLNRLLLDPTAFCERLERVAQRDALIARLVDRASRRGDATQVALRVRQAKHPLGPHLVDRFLRASVAPHPPQR